LSVNKCYKILDNGQKKVYNTGWRGGNKKTN
jgi:hypothetical protein